MILNKRKIVIYTEKLNLKDDIPKWHWYLNKIMGFYLIAYTFQYF